MIKFRKLSEDAKAPVRGSEKAAGLDLCTIEHADIPPGKSATLKTGLSVSMPDGFVGLVWPRSKLGAKKQIQVLAGCIDSDYRGEIMIALQNSGHETFEVRKGDRIAQLLVQQCYIGEAIEVAELDETERGVDGINSLDMRIK